MTNTQREQRQMQGAGTGIYRKHMPATEIISQFALEAADVFSRGEDIAF
jgi:hypothetical protein